MPKTRKIGICHLVQSLGVGGAEILLLHYIKALDHSEFEHFVYCFESTGPIQAEIEKLGVDVKIGPRRASIKRPLAFFLSIIGIFSDLKKYIKKKKIRVIQAHMGHANQLGTIFGKILRIPTFPTVHNTMAFVDRRKKTDIRVHLKKFGDEIIYRMADKVIAVSDEVKQIVQTNYHLNSSDVFVLKNGIIAEFDNIGPVDIETELSVPGAKKKLIAVGSLTYQKAFEVLIKAAGDLVEKGHNDLLVLIVGEGEERPQLENLISDLGLRKWVHLLGLRNDVLGLLKTSDVFIMPSRYEGLSIAMIEAMACGLPIIASDAPGLNSTIQHNHNGLLFAVENHRALSDCITRVLTDSILCQELATAAKDYFRKEFDLSRNIDPFCALIKESVRQG